MDSDSKTQHSKPTSLRTKSTSDVMSGKWWVLVAIGIGTFMSALDGSVVNTILPIVNRSLGSSIAAIEWVITIYLLVLSGLLLSFGRLGDIQGHKAVYISGFAIFLIGSMLCGLAPSVNALIVFRGLQALGAAMLQANSPAILTKSFPAQQRGQALGLQATMTYLGLTIGPSLGGWLVDQFNWRAVFYINIPVGLIALWLSLRHISPDRPDKNNGRFDLPGAFIFTTGLVMLLIGLNQGHALGWTSPAISALLGSALLLLVAFILVERAVSQPMMDLSLFRNRQFSIAVSSAILNYICVYSIIFLMPFYLIQGLNFSPTQTGLLLTAMPVIMAIIAPVSGTLSDRIGTRVPVVFGMCLLTAGLLLLSGLGPETSKYGIALRLSVAGLGIGIFISPNNSALMGAAPPHRQGIAAGTLATARNLGMVLGVGLAGAIFTTSLSRQELQANAIFTAIHASFLVAVGIAALGAMISIIPEALSNTDP